MLPVRNRASTTASYSGPVGERRRRPGRRPAPPQLGAVAGVAGVAPAPERRVGRQGHDRRQPRPDAVHDRDGQLGIVDADVDVHAADDLLPGQLLVLPLHDLVLRIDVGILGPGRERVRAGGRQPTAPLGHDGAQTPSGAGSASRADVGQGLARPAC